MSSYKTMAKNRDTDEEVIVMCLDDYFGIHTYGFQVNNHVLTEEEFYKKYIIAN